MYGGCRKGRALEQTPEFESFKRKCALLWPKTHTKTGGAEASVRLHPRYGALWGRISEIIILLERICVNYSVPVVLVDGTRVAQVPAPLPSPLSPP